INIFYFFFFNVTASFKKEPGWQSQNRLFFDFRTLDYAIKETTTANNATASIKAAAINMAVWNFEAASGWRAIDSIAEPPILPIPNPAPIAAKPAPIAANVPVIVLKYIVKKNCSSIYVINAHGALQWPYR